MISILLVNRSGSNSETKGKPAKGLGGPSFLVGYLTYCSLDDGQILPLPGGWPRVHGECSSSIIVSAPAELRNILAVKWCYSFQNSHVMLDDADIPLGSCGQIRTGFLFIVMREMRVPL